MPELIQSTGRIDPSDLASRGWASWPGPAGSGGVLPVDLPDVCLVRGARWPGIEQFTPCPHFFDV